MECVGHELPTAVRRASAGFDNWNYEVRPSWHDGIARIAGVEYVLQSLGLNFKIGTWIVFRHKAVRVHACAGRDGAFGDNSSRARNRHRHDAAAAMHGNARAGFLISHADPRATDDSRDRHNVPVSTVLLMRIDP